MRKLYAIPALAAVLLLAGWARPDTPCACGQDMHAEDICLTLQAGGLHCWNPQIGWHDHR